jgi:SAM-dependent methyltransferase
MYEFIKNIIRKTFPKRFLVGNEELMRKVMFQLFYKGEKNKCNVCNSRLKRFISLSNGELLCPNCGSLGRNRKFWEIFKGEIKNEVHILDFSPSRCIYRRLKKINNINYTSSDFAGEFLSDVKFDITKINSGSESFDLIICYHILEHIQDDLLAISELQRVLKSGGKCYIQTPFKEGEIYENPEIIDPIKRIKHFGQKDHVRVYSIEGLKNRIEKCGLSVEIFKFENKKDNFFGYNEVEHILCARKSK